MIDIHCHPLPAVDDGAETPEIAAAMCRMAAADGITHLVATPHCNSAYAFNPQANREKLAELQVVAGENPKLLLGCDFRLSYDNIQHLHQNPADFTLNGSSYLLVEFAELFVPEHMERALYEIERIGLTPIFTHPERNPVFRRKHDLLYRWVRKGCLCQVTAQSYTGAFGPGAQKSAERWLEQNLIHFFASDAHDVNHRPPILSECYKKLSDVRGEAEAMRLLISNPEAVIQGEPLPPGPQPIEAAKLQPKKRTWFSFLWR